MCVVRLPRSYLYCSSCSNNVGLPSLHGDCQVEVQPRPWVEVVSHNVPHNSNHLTILQESGTFQRLGMKPDLAVLEAEQLQTRPMSSARPLEQPGQRNQIISPTSAEVFARRDTARSKLSRMSSRRTLQFKSPVEQQGWLTVPRQEGAGQSQSESERESGASAQTVIRVNTQARSVFWGNFLQWTEGFSLQETASQ